MVNDGASSPVWMTIGSTGLRAYRLGCLCMVVWEVQKNKCSRLEVGSSKVEGILTFWINCTSVVYFAIQSDKTLVVFGQRQEYLDLIAKGSLYRIGH